MNKKFIFSVLLVCLLAFVTVFAFSQNSPRNVERWEYTVIEGGFDSDSVLSRANQLGAEGWELASYGQNSTFVFKRRLP
jgi:O-antigen ligase